MSITHRTNTADMTDEELAAWLETDEAVNEISSREPGDMVPVRAIQAARDAQPFNEDHLADVVRQAHTGGLPWSMISLLLDMPIPDAQAKYAH